MKKSMMLGMAALALTVTVAPMQANAAGQGNCLQLNNCVQTGNCIQAGNAGNVFVYGVNCDTNNIKDTVQNILNSNCGNLGNISIGNGDLNNILNGNCGNLGDILGGICGPNTGCETPDNEGTTEDTTEDTEEDTEDNTDLTYAQQVVNLVNVERAREGLTPLTLDTTVTKAANVRAMEIQSSFSHTRPNGSSFSTVLGENGVSYRGSGENIAYGQRSPEEVVTGWMNSPGHRANIMNQNFKNIGVGHAQNSNGTQYWVQLFTY